MLKMNSRGVLGAMVLMAALGAGCKKNAPVPPPRSRSGADRLAGTPIRTKRMGRPTIASFTVEPTTVERGQSATLKWSVTNATSVIIDHGIGSVDVSGQRTVVPADSTTYALTARNENGSAAATATVNVTVPPETPEKPAARMPRRTSGSRSGICRTPTSITTRTTSAATRRPP